MAFMAATRTVEKHKMVLHMISATYSSIASVSGVIVASPMKWSRNERASPTAHIAANWTGFSRMKYHAKEQVPILK